MSEYVIEKDVPVPAHDESKTKYSKMPHRHMQVGDSFLAALDRKNSLSNANSRYKKTLGYVFRTEEENGMLRTWRVK
ncbi:MAG: hypothetical protein EBR82_12090 [Caulobacteraceae bacterium]|nr:hypothetical protein [Caulobacteraceae bacterium]